MSNAKYTCITLADTSALDDFAAVAHNALRESIVEFRYPDALRQAKHLISWQDFDSEIRESNHDALTQIAGRAGVYAILEAKKNQDWKLMYIGQTASKFSRSRICSHLVWRNKGTESGKFTGSKFDEVQAAVLRGNDIALSFVEINPATLRHYVESYMIHKKQPEWNIHGTTLEGQRKRGHRSAL